MIYESQAPVSPTRHLHIEFKNVAVQNKAKSMAAGRPIFDQQEQVFIKFVGDPKKELVAPAHEKCQMDKSSGYWLTYAQMYPRHYEAFKKGEAVVGEGTPIDLAPFLDVVKKAELRALNIHTVEALAGVEGPALAKLGMYGRDLKNKAQSYIDNASAHAGDARLTAENEDLKARLAAMEAQMAAMLSGQQAGGPVPPEASAPEAEESVFAAWDDTALKAFIKKATGQAPRGTPSHESLVRMAEEAHANQAEAA